MRLCDVLRKGGGIIAELPIHHHFPSFSPPPRISPRISPAIVRTPYRSARISHEWTACPASHNRAYSEHPPEHPPELLGLARCSGFSQCILGVAPRLRGKGVSWFAGREVLIVARRGVVVDHSSVIPSPFSSSTRHHVIASGPNDLPQEQCGRRLHHQKPSFQLPSTDT